MALTIDEPKNDQAPVDVSDNMQIWAEAFSIDLYTNPGGDDVAPIKNKFKDLKVFNIICETDGTYVFKFDRTNETIVAYKISDGTEAIADTVLSNIYFIAIGRR